MSQKLVFLVWMSFLLIIMTYPSSLNANFSETMQDTETKISQFIVEGTAKSNKVSNCQ